MEGLDKFDILEQRYEELAASIVLQAADDYKRYRFLLDTINYRKYKDEVGKCIAFNRADKEIKNVEYFFHSSWFYALSGLNGERALIGLEKTYRNEYYPVRMAEMLDETKTGRFRVYEQD